MLKTYELIKMLTPKLGEEEAKELVSFVEEAKGEVATKADLETQSRVFKADFENISRTFKAELQNFATKADLQILKTDLEKQIQTVKVDLLKWFFGFWITIIIAIIIAFFKA